MTALLATQRQADNPACLILAGCVSLTAQELSARDQPSIPPVAHVREQPNRRLTPPQFLVALLDLLESPLLPHTAREDRRDDDDQRLGNEQRHQPGQPGRNQRESAAPVLVVQERRA